MMKRFEGHSTSQRKVKRVLLIATGSLAAALVIPTGVLLLASGTYKSPAYMKPWSQSYARSFDDPRLQLAAHGILAASGHNMQPWRIRMDGQQPDVFYLYADAARQTIEVDPLNRQMMVTQGTFLEYVRVAGEELGYALEIQLFPHGAYDEHRLTESMGQRAVARISLRHKEAQPSKPSSSAGSSAHSAASTSTASTAHSAVSTSTASSPPSPASTSSASPSSRSFPASPSSPPSLLSALYPFLFWPDTNRSAYRSAPLTDGQANSLRSMGDDTLTVEVYEDQENRGKLDRYAIDAAKIEAGVSRVMAESERIFRANEFEKNRYRYGFSIEGQGTSGPMKHVLQGLITLFPSMNRGKTASDRFVQSVEDSVKHTPAYVLIRSRDNSREAQVKAGMLYSRLLLQAHALGLAVQPLSQALEEYPEMKPVYKGIHRDYAPDSSTIQMLLRIGQPEKKAPLSMRRDLTDFITADE